MNVPEVTKMQRTSLLLALLLPYTSAYLQNAICPQCAGSNSQYATGSYNGYANVEYVTFLILHLRDMGPISSYRLFLCSQTFKRKKKVEERKKKAVKSLLDLLFPNTKLSGLCSLIPPLYARSSTQQHASRVYPM